MLSPLEEFLNGMEEHNYEYTFRHSNEGEIEFVVRVKGSDTGWENDISTLLLNIEKRKTLDISNSFDAIPYRYKNHEQRMKEANRLESFKKVIGILKKHWIKHEYDNYINNIIKSTKGVGIGLDIADHPTLKEAFEQFNDTYKIITGKKINIDSIKSL